MMRGSIRRFSTGPMVDELLNIAQLSGQHERPIQLAQLIKSQMEKTVTSDLLTDVIHRWSLEQPARVILQTQEMNKDRYQKFTFNDIHTQSSRLANVLTGKEFDLTLGKTVCPLIC